MGRGNQGKMEKREKFKEDWKGNKLSAHICERMNLNSS